VKSLSKDETIYIGKKPVNSYVMAGLKVIGDHGSVTLKARGRSISHAVDVAEVLKRTLDLDVETIDIGTEVLSGEDEQERNVSTIAICLTK
jgi:DNA-binding protein